MLRALLVALLLCVPVTAHAQLTAPNRRDVVEHVAERCPGLIRQDHAFTDAVATVLNREDERWGRNGKRGNAKDPSHDAIAYRNPASPFGVSIVDIIGAAGSPSASPAWIDQTQATINAGTTGVWVRPSGVLPACLTGGPVTPDEPAPDEGSGEPAAPAVDLGPVLAALAAIDARLAALERRPAFGRQDLANVEGYVDDMIGRGPADDPDTPNHVTDLKERADRNRALLEDILRILRASRLLRY